MERVQRIGHLEAGQAEHALVHRPHRDLGRHRRPLPVGGPEGELHRVPRAVLDPIGRHLHRQPLALRLHLEAHVADPHLRATRILATVLGIGLGHPAPHQHHAHVEVGDALGADRHVEGGGRALERHVPHRLDAVAFHGEHGLRGGERALHQDLRRLPDVVDRLVRDQVDPVRVVALPGHPAFAHHVDGGARRLLALLAVGELGLEDVEPGELGGEGAGAGSRLDLHRAAGDLLLDGLAQRLPPIAEGLLAHELPVTAEDGDLDLGALALTGGRDGDGLQRHRLVDLREAATVALTDAGVERRGVQVHRRPVGDPLAVHVGHLGLDGEGGRAPAGRLRLTDGQLHRALAVGLRLPGADHVGGGHRVLVVPLPGVHPEGEPGVVGRLVVVEGPGGGPAHRRPGHRPPEEVAGQHPGLDRVAGEEVLLGGGDVHLELRRPVLLDAEGAVGLDLAGGNVGRGADLVAAEWRLGIDRHLGGEGAEVGEGKAPGEDLLAV